MGIKTNNHWLSNRYYNTTSVSLVVDDPLIVKDTYITNVVADTKVLAFERLSEKFIELNDVKDGGFESTLNYTGGDKNNLLYQSRATMKIGGAKSAVYRSVLIVDMSSYIENNLLGVIGYTSGINYSILNANLTVTSSEGKTSGNVYALMLPLGISTDESASWYKPSEVYGATWAEGGSVEPVASEISPLGTWNGYDLSFNITPFINIWRGSTARNFAVLLFSDEDTEEVLSFHTQQSASPLIGAKAQTNCVFLGANDTNSISTEGTVVKIVNTLPYVSVQSAETDAVAAQRWSAFNASISVGDTFSMYLPDISATAGVYTLTDKRSGGNGVELIVSGSTSGFSTQIHAAAEFSCTARVPSGSGIVQFTNPDNSLLVDLAALKPNDTVIFDYIPTVSPNNATSYTIDFYSDERNKNDRIRLYVKEQTASENRSGLNTSLKRSRTRPRISLDISF